MKRIVFTVALMAVFSAPLHAQSYVWFETDNAVANSPVPTHAGGIGQRLDLQCGNSESVCKWTIKMFTNVPAGILGWTGDLITAPGGPAPLAASNGFQGTNNPFTGPNSLAQFGTGGTGQSLLTGARGQTFTPPPAGTYHLLSFTLTKPAGLPGQEYSADIHARVPGGIVVWANMNAEMEFVAFGPNPLIQMNKESPVFPPLPVIRVDVVPEPGSLTLLAIAGSAVIFRRRRAHWIA